VALETAFADSINTVAVKLSERVNRRRVIDMAHRLGVDADLTPHPSLALGSSEMSLAALTAAYAAEPFLEVLPMGRLPAMKHVRGSNFCHIGVVGDRLPGRATVVATLDNLCKGSSGQALQNANLMLGLDETAGLMAPPLYP